MDNEYSEMICDQCMEKASFIQAYLPYSLPSQQICTIKKSDTDENVDIEGVKNESGKQSVNSDGGSSEIKIDGEGSTQKEVCRFLLIVWLSTHKS